MAATTGILLPVGTRFAQAYALNSSGLPNATSTSPYEGVHIEGARAFEFNWPDPRTIEHPGDDTLLQRDALPPLTGATCRLTSSKVDYPVHALLTGIAVGTVAEAKEIALLSDKQGYEPQVGVLMFQQALDSSGTSVEGLRRWRAIIFPKARAVPKKPGMGDNPIETVYDVIPHLTAQRLWGVTLVAASDGYSRTQGFEYMTTYAPMVVAWKGDNSATKFLFSTSHQCADTNKAEVTVNGVHDATAAVATDGVTPTSKPGSSDIVCCFYEWA